MTAKALMVNGKLKEIQNDSLNSLQSQVRGRVILPSDPEYGEACKIWNGMINRRPALIVQCTGTADVIYTVRFAKEHNLLLSVRGGGHNIAGRSLQDDVLLIDLSKMRTVQVDPDERVAVVSPGATLADVDHETQTYGLVLPTGINSTTGISGLTLGGGFGWLSRSLGMTIDNLIAAEVVTVDGKRLVCNKEHNPDLFWGLTGGGGNFGIVTSFKFKLHSMGPDVMCGPIVFDLKDAKAVLSKYRDFCKKCPKELTVWAVMRLAPPLPFINASHHGKPTLILAGLYNGPMEKGKTLFSQLKNLGTSLGDGISPNRFVDFQKTFDPLLTPGARNYWKTHNFKELKDDLIDTLINYANTIPNASTEIFLAQMGGQTNTVHQDATAYPHRDVEFIMNVHTRWNDKKNDDTSISWARQLHEAAKPFATGGAYINFVSAGDDNIPGAYAQNAQKLAKIKSKYDPQNILRFNLNITPID